jgi:hypothetical protein
MALTSRSEGSAAGLLRAHRKAARTLSRLASRIVSNLRWSEPMSSGADSSAKARKASRCRSGFMAVSPRPASADVRAMSLVGTEWIACTCALFRRLEGSSISFSAAREPRKGSASGAARVKRGRGCFLAITAEDHAL